MSASRLFLCCVKTIVGTSIGTGCSNQMQVAQGQDLHKGGALVQAASCHYIFTATQLMK